VSVWAKWKLPHEQRMLLLALAAGLPAVVVAIYFLWSGAADARIMWPLTALIVAVWWFCANSIRERIATPLRTLANLLEAMREGDYSIRGPQEEGALGEVIEQMNAMGATLRAQRLGALEATALLRKVMEEIDVAIFAFDGARRLRLVNRAGERLLGKASERIITSDAAELGLSEYLEGDESRTVQRTFATGAGRWSVTRSQFREGGLPHQLLVVSDLTRALREEELKAWQRLVRVLGHEFNNSLAPIKSIAGSLETLVTRNPLPDDWREDTTRGLSIIASRSDGLSRFLGAYTLLAKLPPPQFAPMTVGDWVRHAAVLERRITASVEPGPEISIHGDRVQLEQVLINLLRNAADASLETGGEVRLGWSKRGSLVEVWVADEGPGLPNTANLFVPFFTTKPGGSGIGLVLSRQVAESHGGSLELRNRAEGRGCEARLILPLAGISA
jgi:two-component system, NtrC family, nitrogen regulation sensor histidine kinase NtrY